MKVTKENKSHTQKEKNEIFQDADFPVGLTDSKLTSDGMLCQFGGHTLVSTCFGHARKQTAMSHSGTEAEVISLDTGLRMEGLRALTLGY